MSQLEVRLEEDRSAFRPGSELRGTASWHLDAAVRKIELRLCWFTQGPGIQEARVVATVCLERTDKDASQSFRFRLPEAPLSYIGALSALFWAVEMIVIPSQECAHAVFCLSHIGGPVLLAPLPVEEQTG
jgi:hypothetical protein